LNINISHKAIVDAFNALVISEFAVIKTYHRIIWIGDIISAIAEARAVPFAPVAVKCPSIRGFISVARRIHNIVIVLVVPISQFGKILVSTIYPTILALPDI